MKKLAFMNTISRSAHRMAFKLQKHSPEILVVAGVIGAVASAVMACKATTKLGDILDDSRDKIDSIHDVIENPDKVNGEYTQEDGNKDLAIVYTQTALKVAKVYAPAVILGGLSITPFSHLTIFSERGTLHWLQLTQQSTKASKNIVEESLKDSEKNWIKSSVITSKLRKWKRLLPTKKVMKRL